MRKMIVIAAGLLFAACQMGMCQGIGEQITTTLLSRVSAVSQFRNGETRAAAVDSVVLIGKYQGRSILHLQAGWTKDTTTGENASFIYGAQFRLDPFVNEKLNLPEAWQFLRSLEHGPAIHYNRDLKGWYGSYQVGLAFGLNPQP